MKKLGFAGFFIVAFLVVLSSADSGNALPEAMDECEPGCLIGAYLGCGPDESCVSIDDFNLQMGKKHALFVRYMDIETSRDAEHWNWARNVTDHGAAPVFMYDPYGGLDSINTTDVIYFAEKCSQLPATVFIVFGHEMNLRFYPWGNQPESYKAKFREIAEISHKIAPNTVMCWVPNQNWGYPWGGIDYGDGYSEFYPDGVGEYGEYVDWVGLDFYDKDWDEDNRVASDMFIANIRKGDGGIDFYETFAAGKGKPMMIAETGAFDPNHDPTLPGVRVPLDQSGEEAFKNDWIGQVFNASLLETEFPQIHAICYFHVLKNEQIDTETHIFPDIPADYRIPPGLYPQLVAGTYFIPARIRGDLNGNGILDWGDVVKCAYMSWGLVTPCIGQADFNNNGSVDWGDVVKLAYGYWGLLHGV